ncbi:hypothetical protein BT96DRAFT_947351 [Gymnopus androsaceus JB14]|uniref:DDE-1 domain-containing protein n=1 Tax=Gymnopus androsaceus JB14 TaxID=1447944 RepID=A0A6A4GTL5_9AGAR|nr:hypothetical protein BT96DRAFT_947351 [Gymnopus androsaceus JB14]
MDGHSSHFTPDVIKFTMEHNIGLNVVYFARMKAEMKRLVVQFEDENQHIVVKAAFSATGIFPFNPGVICPEQLVSAEVMSIKGSFTLMQMSPIRAIMTTFWTYQPTLFDTSPYHARLPLRCSLVSTKFTSDIGYYQYIQEYPWPTGTPLHTCKLPFEKLQKAQEVDEIEPWSPFQSQEEWELAHWLMELGASQGKINQFLKLKKVM